MGKFKGLCKAHAFKMAFNKCVVFGSQMAVSCCCTLVIVLVAHCVCLAAKARLRFGTSRGAGTRIGSHTSKMLKA